MEGGGTWWIACSCSFRPGCYPSLMEGKEYIESGGKVDLYKEALPREKEDGRLTESLQVRI